MRVIETPAPAARAGDDVERGAPVRRVAVADERDGRVAARGRHAERADAQAAARARPASHGALGSCAPRPASGTTIGAQRRVGARLLRVARGGAEAARALSASDRSASRSRLADLRLDVRRCRRAATPTTTRRRRRERRASSAARAAQQAAAADRVLDEHLGQPRERAIVSTSDRDAASVRAAWPSDERGEDEQRPVPEVDRVGDVAEELHRRDAQQRARRPARRAAPGADHRAAPRAPAAAPRARGTASRRCRRAPRRRSPARPEPDSARAATGRPRRRRAASSASRPPTPNSQARVGVTKYAARRVRAVVGIEQARLARGDERRARATIAPRRARAPARERRRASISSGQTR